MKYEVRLTANIEVDGVALEFSYSKEHKFGRELNGDELDKLVAECRTEAHRGLNKNRIPHSTDVKSGGWRINRDLKEVPYLYFADDADYIAVSNLLSLLLQMPLTNEVDDSAWRYFQQLDYDFKALGFYVECYRCEVIEDWTKPLTDWTEDLTLKSGGAR